MDEVLAAVIQLWSVLRPIRNTMQKKGLKFALITAAKIYLLHSSKNYKSWPPLGLNSEYTEL